MTDKPPFDPSKPFESVGQTKPDFDPSQPFEAADQSTGSTGKLNAVTGGMIEGVPIVGPIVKGGAERAAAGIRSLMHGTPYADELSAVQDYAKKAADENPITNTAAQLAGGVGATLPLAMTKLGATALGLGGKTLLQQSGRSALSGGVITAADAAVRGNDPTGSGLVGFGIGGLVPGAGVVLGTAASKVASTARGIFHPEEEAIRRTAATILHDEQTGSAGMKSAEFAAEKAAGTPVTLMERGGAQTRDLGRAASNLSSEGSDTLVRTLNDRFDTQTERAADFFKSGKHYPTDAARDTAIRKVKQDVYEPAYEKAFQDAAKTKLWYEPGSPIGKNGLPTRIDPILSGLVGADEVKDAIRIATPQYRNWAVAQGDKAPLGPFVIDRQGNVELRKTSSGNPYVPNLQFWNRVKIALDGMHQSGTASQLSKILRDQLDTLVPAYKDARASAQPTKFFDGARNAHEAGQNFVGKMEAFGPQAETALNKMTTEERKLFADGYAQSFIEKIDRTSDKRNLLNTITTNPAAKREMETALGPQRARELEAFKRVEGLMVLPRDAIKGNSTTVRQLNQLGLATVVGGGTSAALGGNPLDPQAMVVAALTYGAARGKTAINAKLGAQIAKLLVSNDEAKVAQGMRMIAQPRFLSALRNADAALARAGSVQLEPTH